MTSDDIIRMAREAWVLPDAHIPNVLEFANLVAAAKREWQGLTDEEANELTYASIAEIEAKLKEKNT